MDELARRARHRPVRAAPAQRRSCRATRSSSPIPTRRPTCTYGGYGLDQCLDLAEDGARASRASPRRPGADWRIGTGMALGDDRDHAAARALQPSVRLTLDADGGLRARRSAPRSSATARRPCTRSSSRERARRSPPDRRPHPPVRHRRGALRHRRVRLGRHRGGRQGRAPRARSRCCDRRARRGRTRRTHRRRAASDVGRRASAARRVRAADRTTGSADGTPARGSRFNVHGVPGRGDTGDRRGADPAVGAGRRRRHACSTPSSCAGRSRAAPPRRSARRSTRRCVIDCDGQVLDPAFRNYHVPQLADVPRDRGAASPTPTTTSGRSARSR